MHLLKGSSYRVSLERASCHFEKGMGNLSLITAFELGGIHNYIITVGNILIFSSASFMYKAEFLVNCCFPW